MISTFKRAGFTLIELLVVIGMLAIIMAAMTASVNGARERAKIEKARSEVKAVTQAILAYENYSKSGLPTCSSPGKVLSASNFGFLLGKQGTDQSGVTIPVLLEAALSSGGTMLDPWGNPYKVVIQRGKVAYQSVSTIRTGFSLPNINRLSAEERK